MKVVNILSLLPLANAGLIPRQFEAYYDSPMDPVIQGFSAWAIAYTELGVATDWSSYLTAGTDLAIAEGAIFSAVSTTAENITKNPPFDDTTFPILIEDVSRLGVFVNLTMQGVVLTRPKLDAAWQEYTVDALLRQYDAIKDLWIAVWDKADETQRKMAWSLFYPVFSDIYEQFGYTQRFEHLLSVLQADEDSVGGDESARFMRTRMRNRYL